MGLSASHLLIILLIVLVVFGAGKLPTVMKDLGHGIRSFKDAMSGDKESPEETPRSEASVTPSAMTGQSRSDVS